MVKYNFIKIKYCKKSNLSSPKNPLPKCKNCNTVASFGFPGTKRKETCATHKEEGMIDLRHAGCPICGRQASFGFPNSFKLFCSKHKYFGMIDLKHKRCSECDKQAHYGDPTQKKKIFCAKHKREGMILLTK